MRAETYSPGQIVELLREVEAGQAGGKTVEDVCRALAVSAASDHRWKGRYGGTKAEGVKRLRQPVAGLSLGVTILKEADRGS